MYHLVHTPYTSWKSFLEKNGVNIEDLDATPSGNNLISVRKFTKVLFSHAESLDYHRGYFDKCSLVVRLFMIAIPYIVRGAATDGWAILYYISSGIILYIFLNVNLLFLFCPMFDAQRREVIARALQHMVSVSSIHLEPDPVMRSVPKVDLRYAQNVYSWMYTRLILQSYGKRMLFRFDSYIGAYLVIGLGLTIALIYNTFIATPYELFAMPIFVHTLLFVFVLLTVMSLIIYLFSNVNDRYCEHLQAISLNELKLESELSKLIGKKENLMFANKNCGDVEQEIWRRDESIKALGRASEVIRISNELNPLKV